MIATKRPKNLSMAGVQTANRSLIFRMISQTNSSHQRKFWSINSNRCYSDDSQQSFPRSWILFIRGSKHLKRVKVWIKNRLCRLLKVAIVPWKTNWDNIQLCKWMRKMKVRYLHLTTLLVPSQISWIQLCLNVLEIKSVMPNRPTQQLKSRVAN